MKEFKIVVLGQEYTVRCGTLKECEMTPDLDGQCHIYAKRIHLNTGDNPAQLDETEDERWCRIKNTAAHEVFHAYCTEAGIYLPDNVEEQLATFFGFQWEKMNDTVKDILHQMGEEV